MTFALDCCDREAMGWTATTGGHSGDVVRDVMLAATEHRLGNVGKAPAQIEWLSDNGSGYIAEKTRAFASDIGLKPLTTPVCNPPVPIIRFPLLLNFPRDGRRRGAYRKKDTIGVPSNPPRS